MGYQWQIYCGFYPIAAGKGLAISGVPGRRLVWRTKLDAVTIMRLRSGLSMYIGVNNRWMLYRLESITAIVSNTYDVVMQPIEDLTPDRLRDRVQQLSTSTVGNGAIGKIETAS